MRLLVRELGVFTAFMAAAVVIATFAGCGGGSGSSTADTGQASSEASAPPQTTRNPEKTAAPQTNPAKAAFIEQANAACKARAKQVQEKGNRAFREHGTKAEGKIFKRILINDVIIPEFEGEIHDLEALESPPGDEKQIERILAAIHHIVHQVETNPAAEGYYPYHDAERLSKAYGIPECGRP
ncbi:MAG TPA: hypothetical protein VKC63_12625 [Solirubrobacterales bacterium]|nr:hypothetical protein [Solirubrobacterales bacterium]